jgi:hypothetical protein
VRGSRLVKRRLGCLDGGQLRSSLADWAGPTHGGRAESILPAMMDGCHRRQQQLGLRLVSRCSSYPDLG